MIRDDLNSFLKTIPDEVCVVAATKYLDASLMRKLYDKGIVNFGENRTDSFLKKYDELKDLNITWHFIGHLQKNKAKSIINKISYLHSLDSLELASIIEANRIEALKVFVEVNTSGEESKNGIKKEDAISFVKELMKYKKIEVIGLMTMAMKSDSNNDIVKSFIELKELLNTINNSLKINLKELSMGMSEDYEEAIANGATYIRLGRILLK